MRHHVLFIGLGGVGQRHLRNLRQLYGSEIDISAYRVRRENTLLSDRLTAIEGGDLEKEYQVAIYDDLSCALLQRPNIAIIANPTSLHIPVAAQALNSGCDLFVEKPLSSDLDGVAELSRQAASEGRVGYVAYQLRFHPSVQKLQESLRLKKCGTIYGARAEVAEYLPGFHPFEDYRRMYASRKELGGGVTLTQIHEIDLLYTFFGIPEQVYSVGGHISDLEIDVEDSATSLLTFRKSCGGILPVSLHQDYLGRPPRRSLLIWGSEGQLLLDLREGTLTYTDTRGKQEVLSDASGHPRNALFLDEMRHFFDCVETRKRPLCNLEDGAASLSIALALLESQKSGKACMLPQPNARAA